MPSSRTIGPLIRANGNRPDELPILFRLNFSSASASTAARIIGICSGLQPAITAFAATFHGVANRLAEGSVARCLSGASSVWRRKASTRCTVGGMIGRPSVQSFASKKSFTSSSVPENTILRGSQSSLPAFEPAPASSCVRPSTIFSNRTFLIFSWITLGASVPSVPGYSAMRRPSTPPAFALSLASVVKPVAVTTTAGIPSCSIATAGRTAAGEQVPQAPLPEMIASQPFSFARAASCFA